MDEPLFRLALIIGVALIAVTLGLVLGRRPRRTAPNVAGIVPGVVLFASKGCDSCAAAEKLVREAVGPDYRVIVWEDDPDTFQRARVRAVPLVAVVGAGGLVWWAEGAPNVARLRQAAARSVGPAS